MMHQLDSTGLQPSELIQSIWQAGVDAVASEVLVKDHLTVNDQCLTIGSEMVPLTDFDQIIVVGAGKAGAGMARGVTEVLSQERLQEKSIVGFVNVPDDCIEPNPLIQLHPSRPAGVNEPRQAGVDGAMHIMNLVKSANKRDLVICLISGGGSALLPLPIEGITIEQKTAATRHLSRNGATINELNLVRRALSKIKGGGLLNACNAHSIHTLIISDVMGNPLETIGSGPTFPCKIEFERVLKTLKKFDPDQSKISPAIYEALHQRYSKTESMAAQNPAIDMPPFSNLIIGDISTATVAAEKFANRLGLQVMSNFASTSEPGVELVAENIWNWILQNMKNPKSSATACYISGGEPTVQLNLNSTGKGGRNQHLVLLLLKKLSESNWSNEKKSRIHFLAGGTDGEDGPTDAAGAIGSFKLLQIASEKGISIEKHIEQYDSYNFFKTVGGHLITGPTHTNVCDLRIAMISPA